MKKLRKIKAWCVVKNGKLLANEVYTDKDIILAPNEKLVKVLISEI